MENNQNTISAFQKLERLRILLTDFAHIESAPVHLNNEEASAWACGYNDLRNQTMNILNQNDN